MQDSITLRSNVSSKQIWRSLRRGSLVAALGTALLLYAGTQVAAERLSFWGAPIFVLGLSLIAGGLIPYRRLVGRALKPAELRLAMDSFSFADRERLLFTVPYSCIEHIAYSGSGIACHLKQAKGAICVHDQFFPMQRFMCTAQRQYSCDLHFDDFSKEDYVELQEVLDAFRDQPE